MMIRERRGAHTSTVLLIRVYWDKERKRSAQKVLGSFSAYSGALPDELAGPNSPLTDEEKAEALAWIAEREARRKLTLLPGVGRRIVQQADELASALEDPEKAEAALQGLDHLALYGALDRLAKALRKHHLARPPRKKKGAGEEEATLPAPQTTESLS